MPHAGTRRRTTSSGSRHDTPASLARRSGHTALKAARTLRDLGEMGQAAAATIAHRSLLMAEAARDPRLLADPELSLMVTEKLEAAGAVAAALVPKLALPGLHAQRWLGAHMALLARDLARPWTPGAVTTFWADWQRMVEGMMLINAAYAAAMLGTAVELGAVALRPVHKAATANARRLGRQGG